MHCQVQLPKTFTSTVYFHRLSNEQFITNHCVHKQSSVSRPTLEVFTCTFLHGSFLYGLVASRCSRNRRNFDVERFALDRVQASMQDTKPCDCTDEVFVDDSSQCAILVSPSKILHVSLKRNCSLCLPCRMWEPPKTSMPSEPSHMSS